MSKYIDGEKLKAHIEAKMEILWDKLPDADKEHPTDIELRDLGMYMALEGLIDDLDSLQQEQQDCHTVEDWIQHIQNADQLTKDIFSKGPYDVLYDALNHPYQHCYDAIKEFGELCFQTGVNSVKQGQPEVDLDRSLDFIDSIVRKDE